MAPVIAATPKMISSQLVVLAELRYTGTSPRPAAPMSAYHGAPPTVIMISAIRLSDSSGGKLAPDAVEITIPDSAPAIPARYAEMQNTITIVTRTLVRLVVSASGESDIERSRRPRRLRVRTTTATAASAVISSTT